MSPPASPPGLVVAALGMAGCIAFIALGHVRPSPPSAGEKLPAAVKMPRSIPGKNSLPGLQFPPTWQLERSESDIAGLTTNEPGAAFAHAARDTNPGERISLLSSVLRVWAASQPDAAVDAAWSEAEEFRPQLLVAALEGMASSPADALRIGSRLCREDPDRAWRYGSALITTLAKGGRYAEAIAFALDGSPGISGDERNRFLVDAFSDWAEREPKLAALAATNDLPEGYMRQEALLAVVRRWRMAEAEGPESFVLQLPIGAERAALIQVLTAIAPADR